MEEKTAASFPSAPLGLILLCLLSTAHLCSRRCDGIDPLCCLKSERTFDGDLFWWDSKASETNMKLKTDFNLIWIWAIKKKKAVSDRQNFLKYCSSLIIICVLAHWDTHEVPPDCIEAIHWNLSLSLFVSFLSLNTLLNSGPEAYCSLLQIHKYFPLVITWY